MHIQYQIRHQAFWPQLSKNLQFPLHLHRHCELIYVTDGAVDVVIRDKEICLQKGDLAIIFPEMPHSYRSSEENKCNLIIFDPSFTPEFSRIMNEKYPLTPYLLQGDIHADIRYNLFSLFYDESGDVRRQKAYLTIILSRIFEKLPFTDIPAISTPKETINKVLSYISTHFLENISLEHTADILGISKYHLSHIFSQKVGGGFIPYVHSLRIEHACELLLTTDLSVTDIAFESGFESAVTFHRVFRNSKGESPLQYKKKNMPII